MKNVYLIRSISGLVSGVGLILTSSYFLQAFALSNLQNKVLAPSIVHEKKRIISNMEDIESKVKKNYNYESLVNIGKRDEFFNMFMVYDSLDARLKEIENIPPTDSVRDYNSRIEEINKKIKVKEERGVYSFLFFFAGGITYLLGEVYRTKKKFAKLENKR